MNYTNSYYAITTDILNSRKDRILYCTRTGEAVVLSKRIFDLYESKKYNDIPKDIFDKLLKNKAIVPIEENELLEIVNGNKDAISDEQNTTLYEVIQPSAMCQLGCDYCGQKHTKDYLNSNLYENLANRIREKAKNGNYKNLYIGWFGGEPLMGLPQMRELTKIFKEIASEYNMGYSSKIVTNGLSLKENIFFDLIQNLNVNSIEVTLDGISKYHDEHRPTKEGKNSFDIIFNNLLKICNLEDFEKLGCKISIRCNVDHRNIEGVSPLIKLLAKHNLHEKIAYFYPIGVYSWGNDAHKKSLTKEDFAKMEIDWYIEMIELGFKSLSLIPGRVKKVCLAVSPTSEMYDAFGNIFNCTEVSYVPNYVGTDYIIGNLKDNPSLESRTKAPLVDWNDTLLTDKYPCHTCKMLPFCGGGCPKSWHEDMRACPTPKFNIKEKLMLSYVLSQKDIKELV